MKSIFILNPDLFNRIYPPYLRRKIAEHAVFKDRAFTAEEILSNPSCLEDIDVIFSSWGMVPLTQQLLQHAPRMKAVFYAAGSIRYFTTDAFWDRKIKVASAYTVNGEWVAKFTLAQILLALKNYWHACQEYQQRKSWFKRDNCPGMYNSKIGIISLGAIGRQVVEYLKPFDLDIYAYDPFWTQEKADEIGVTLLPLEEIFSICDVVSLHTPWLPETVGMITGEHIQLMKPNTTFINTARGAVVREEEMIATLVERPDITALLDVTYPEPPAADSTLWSLPNVVLSPHIAGSISGEVEKMGALMVDEFIRWINDQPLQHEISQEKAGILA
ncbi:MAG: hydroxyacid dehydrogenase [Anaerolineae bacterium]|nr:hydroxyacid dehydrogenase [Anaerolineae bacterium]